MKTSNILKAIKTYRLLLHSAESTMELIEHDENSGERLYKRIRSNKIRLTSIHKRISSIKSSKYGSYLNKSPQEILVDHLGAILR